MKGIVLVLLLIGATATLWLAYDRSTQGPGDAVTPAATAGPDPVDREATPSARTAAPNATTMATGANDPSMAGGGTTSTDDATFANGTTAATPTGSARWPLQPPRPGIAGGDADATTGPPAVTAEVALQALRYVGVDPAAEATWLRAINDPKMPAGTRSDLIEDLNEQGYTDNGRPTAADLPLVLARLQLIERLAPLATDPVNAAAFEEAYKDLLEMYVRLGGKPREGR